jgi:hypothetical protein
VFLVPLESDETQRAEETSTDGMDEVSDSKGLDDAAAPEPAAWWWKKAWSTRPPELPTTTGPASTRWNAESWDDAPFVLIEPTVQRKGKFNHGERQLLLSRTRPGTLTGCADFADVHRGDVNASVAEP